jgi:hypothetical protein
MERKLVLKEFKGQEALLIDKEGKEVLWPKDSLPKNLKEGDKLSFLISEQNSDQAKREQSAKDLLNEILSTE